MCSLDDNMDQFVLDETVKLIAKDQSCIEINKKLCTLSEVIKIALEHDKDCNELKLEMIPNRTMLETVVNYLKLQNGTEPPKIIEPLQDTDMYKVTTETNAKFVNELLEKGGMQALYNTIEAANYLELKSLLLLVCAKLAALIKATPLSQIEEFLSSANKPVGPLNEN